MKKILFFYFTIFIFYSCGNRNIEIYKEEYRGTISDIYEDSMNHYMMRFNVRINKTFYARKDAGFYPKSWEYAQVGDSIIKKKGCMYIIIKKQNGDSAIFCYK